MKTARFLMFIGMVNVILFASSIAYADDFFVYPEAGQSKEQTEKDKFECYEWAKSQTGFDPMATPKASTPPPQAEAPQGGAVRGAARGRWSGWPWELLPEMPVRVRPSVQPPGDWVAA